MFALLKTGPQNVCVINFENKSFDKIHIYSIFRYEDVISQLAELFPTDGNISVLTMKLTKTIRNKILNHRDTVQVICYE